MGNRYFFQPRSGACLNRASLNKSMYCSDCPDGYVDRGEWVAGTTYSKCDMVTALGQYWIATADTDGTYDQAPAIGTAWTRVFTPPYALMDFSNATIEPVGGNPNGVTAQFLRASAATVVDYEGKLVTVPADTPRFQSARYVRNEFYKTDGIDNNGSGVANIGWCWDISPFTGTVTVTKEAGAGPQGQDAFRVIKSTPMESTGSALIQQNINPLYPEGSIIRQSWWVKPLPGSPTIFSLKCGRGGWWGDAGDSIDLPVDQWTRISTLHIAEGNDGQYFGLNCPNDTGLYDFYCCEPMLEIVNGHQNQNPSEYVESSAASGTQGLEVFPYLNGNTVVNGIVTEAQGSSIRGITYLNEPAATNICTDSENLEAFFTASGDGGSILGNTVTFAADELSRVFNSAAVSEDTNNAGISFRARCIGGGKVRVYVTNVVDGPNVSEDFILTDVFQTFKVVLTKTGAAAECGIRNGSDGVARTVEFEWLQLEDNSDVVTSYIPTAGAPVTREADDLRYIGGPTAEISMQISFENDVQTPNNGDFRLFGSEGTSEIRATGTNNWEFGIAGGGGFFQGMTSIAVGKNQFSGGYENGNQKAYLNGAQRNVQAEAWTPNHSDQYIQIGRWGTVVTVFPLRFSAFKLWNLALPDDELEALSSQDWNCSGA